MLESATTSMSLKTDQIAGALRIEIHPRKSWSLIFDFMVLAIWGALFYASFVGYENRSHIGRSTSEAIAILALTMSLFLWSLYATLKALFYYEIVTTTSSTLQIQGHLLSFTTSDQQYTNSLISQLRYEEWSGGRSGTQNGIRFEYNGETVTFARQVDTSDSWDLIDRVREVYPFPTPAPDSSPAVTHW